ncbi:hypothetical protein [Pseudomarimonas arenosa]|uniref:Lipoprotein n=1 Tax=Pseudomarimonas arenosa TaxID=2774145 RepID=A0AAW3ZMH6_9GAMM|nr:hypothetical protein [Pseudomarimonas arenosa]MBD8526374.1 hypothetical protein [Pseudomarimonas arenosa]
MLRAILVLMVTIFLGGCATQQYRYYGADSYRRGDPGWQAVEPLEYSDAGYVDGGYRFGVNYYDYPDWVDYPYYYSLFWSFNRAWVDPFWHPHFYYGVTWYPRNYFSVTYRYFPSYRYHYGRPFYAYLSYSPYRYAWVDYYYDWYPWYAHYPHYSHRYYAPRYGNSRNEAERLARLHGLTRDARYSRNPQRYHSGSWDQTQSRRAVDAQRQSVRGADRYGETSRRRDPAVSGFQRGVSAGESAYGDRNARSASYGEASSSRREAREFSPQRQVDSSRAPMASREAAASGRTSRINEPRVQSPPARDASQRGIPYPDRSSSGTLPQTTPRYSSTPPADSFNRSRQYAPRSTERSREATGYSPPREPIRYNAPAAPAPSYSPPPRVDFGAGRADGGRGAERSAPRIERSEPAPRSEPVERVDRGRGSRAEAGRFGDRED